MDQPVTTFDLHRMFIGDQPLLFYAEILIRTVIIYAYTLLMIRWIGGRGVAQMSMVEFVLVIALGSAVGDSMFYPDVPVLYGMGVITIVIGMNKLLDVAMRRSDRAKDIIDGRPVEVARDGRLNIEGLEICDMGPAEVKALLRQAGIRNLGTVSRAYLETGGAISVFRRDDAPPGLSLVPPSAVAPDDADDTPDDAPDRAPGLVCCASCGALAPGDAAAPAGECRRCGGEKWVAPRQDRDGKETDA